MKKILKIIGILVLVLLVLIVATPLLFKNRITEQVKIEMGKQLDAEVKFESVKLSIFSGFPNMTLSLNNLSVVKTNNDTLVGMKSLLLDMQAWSAIMGNELKIKSLILNTPVINYSAAATDTLQVSDEALADTVSSEDDPFLITLDEFKIENGKIKFSSQADSMLAVVDGINMLLSGDFSSIKTLLNLDLRIDNVMVEQGGETLIKGFPAALKAQIDADLDKMAFTLKENSLILGVLKLELEGKVSSLAAGYHIDLAMNAPVTDMSDLINMLPESFASMLEGIKTDGNIAINGKIVGDFINSDLLPAFDFKFTVSNGVFQYPDLPKSIGNINIKAAITHPDQTDADATVVKISQFSCDFGGNPISSQWVFKTPVSDLNIDGFFKGNVDLATLKDVIPLENVDMRGKINADVKLKGYMSAIEKEEYSKFNASGSMSLKSFWFKSNDVPQGLAIDQSALTFSPAQINLKSFTARMGQSDISLDGTISNYINYVFNNGTLKGKFNHYSNYINANEFLDDDAGEAQTDSSASELFIIPDKLDLSFNTNINKMLFDKLVIRSTRGKVTVKERKAILDGLKMDLLKGNIEMTGIYNSADTSDVFSDMRMEINNIDVAQTTASISAIGQLAPIATYAEGRISLKMNLYSPFKENGEADLNRINSRGYITSPSLLVRNNSALDQLAKVTQNPRYKNPKTGPFKANYIIEKGEVKIEPFDVKVEDKSMQIWGNHALTNTMDYRIKTTVAANELGKDVANLVKLIGDPNKQMPVTVIIRGQVDKPKVSLDAKEAIKQLQKDASKGIFNGLF